MLFKTKNRVPDVYIKESRDFQLISSILDYIYNTLLNNLLKISYMDDIELVDSKLLNLILNYLGFFTSQYYPENLLRSILENFPIIIKNKGSYKGIKIAIESLQNAYTDISFVDLKKGKDEDSFIITTDGIVIDLNYVDELLKYVLPIGAIIELIQIILDIKDLTPDKFTSSDKLWGIFYDKEVGDKDFIVGTIRKAFDEFDGSFNLNYFLSKIGQTPIVKESEIKKVSIKSLKNV